MNLKTDSARETALKVLNSIYKNKAYSNLALSEELGKNHALTRLDKAFITELVYGTLKYTITFDYIIREFSNLKPEKISNWTEIIIKMGMYQIFFMDKVPESAACNESVKLSGKYGHEGTKRFVNGILRNIIRKTSGNINNINFPSLSEKYGYTSWMTEKFLKDFGFENTERIMRHNMKTPLLTARINILKTTRDELIKELEESGIEAIKSENTEKCIILRNTSSINEIEQFKEGKFYIQGESSMLAAKIMNPERGSRILDLCSAPGGKSTHLAEIMGNKGEIISCDIYENKLENIKDNAQRLGITIINTKIMDASVYNEGFKENFDYVLADVPCSGTGVIRSRPEIKINRTLKEVEDIVKLQYDILMNAALYVKKGGILMYSTCSILREENINQINGFLNENKEFYIENGSDVREIFPYDFESDGFFIAKIRRRT